MAGSDKGLVDRLRELNSYYCIEEWQDVTIRGESEMDSLALNIDYIASPALTNQTQSPDECSTPLKDLRDYLVAPELVLLYNTEYFDNTRYDHGTIVKEARFWNQHVNTRQANWM